MNGSHKHSNPPHEGGFPPAVQAAIDELAVDRPRAWVRTITDASLATLSDGYRHLKVWHLGGDPMGSTYFLPPLVVAVAVGGSQQTLPGCSEEAKAEHAAATPSPGSVSWEPPTGIPCRECGADAIYVFPSGCYECGAAIEQANPPRDWQAWAPWQDGGAA